MNEYPLINNWHPVILKKKVSFHILSVSITLLDC